MDRCRRDDPRASRPDCHVPRIEQQRACNTVQRGDIDIAGKGEITVARRFDEAAIAGLRAAARENATR
ncbi:hypothetical protein FJY94_03670, partial [Candidatus Kaiserbacteria bacterium]|nr:hypothetical protein [Candidatus Kaiserbacteria bacterium]